MPKHITATYAQTETNHVAEFMTALQGAVQTDNGVTFDSIEKVTPILSSGSLDGIDVPASLQSVLDELPSDKRAGAMKTVMDGVQSFENQHGYTPTADVIEWAFHQGYSMTTEGGKKGGIRFDSASASSNHSDVGSIQPNRAIVAITTAIAEACPVAHYLPADINSGEAPMVIVSHAAGSNFGDYRKGDLMDGTANGGTYFSSSRMIKLALAGGVYTGKITALSRKDPVTGVVDPESCDPAADSVPLMRGRSIVYINGLVAGEESNSQSTGETSPINGGVRLGGVGYTVSGTIKPATGEVSITVTPALPANTKVTAEAFINYEAAPQLAPHFSTQSDKFMFRASAWYAMADQTVESKNQFVNELGLDISSEAMLSIRNQFANERHYKILKYAQNIGAMNQETFNAATNYEVNPGGKTVAMTWQDFAVTLDRVDQKMAENTMDHGLTHLYVGKQVRSQLRTLSSMDLFRPSGLTARPGIYRLGTLFGSYEVYYNPKAVETPGSSSIIGIGRSSQVARNPFVFGDAVAPMVLPMSMDSRFKYQNGYFAKNFTETNKHAPSAMGCALINVTGIV